MGDLQQYGVSVTPLGRVVRTICLEQGNYKEAMFLKLLKHAQIIWKDIFRTTLWQIKTVPLKICDGVIHLPDDCERLINISVKDQFNHLHPLTQDSDINTAQAHCVTSLCSCSNCHGENTLCGAIDNITATTETIVIQGSDYTKTTWIRYNGCGDIEQVISMPTLNATTEEVEYITSRSTLCTVETTSTGCIKASNPNLTLLGQYCGVNPRGGIGPFGWMGNAVYPELIPAVYNFWGYYNFNAEDPSMVHIFRNNLSDNRATSEHSFGTILVSYQTDGENPGQEILVPDYAYDAMVSGIMYRIAKLNPKDRDRDQTMFNAFRRDKMLLFKYLNPVRMEFVEKLHTQPRLW